MTVALTSVGTQTVSITIPSGSLSATAAVSTVGSGAYATWQGQNTTDGTTATSALARFELTSTVLTTATRDTSSTDTITVSGTIVDGNTSNLISSVQSGTIAFATASATGTATISPITNANSVTHFLGQSTLATTNASRTLGNLSLSGTTLNGQRSSFNGTLTISWQVTAYQGAALNSATQQVSIASTATGTAFSAAVSAVTMANSFVGFGGFLAGASASNYGRCINRGELVSTTSITMTYGVAPAATTNTFKCVLVEFVSGMLAQNIQRGTITLASATSNTATITSSPLAATVVNWIGNSVQTLASGFNVAAAKIVQTNPTTLTMSVNTTSSPVGAYEAINFNPFVGGVVRNMMLSSYF